MTTMTTTVPTSSRGVAAIGVGTAIVAAVCSTLFANDRAEVIVELAVIAVSAALVFGYVVPRALRKESAGGTALGLAIPAVLIVAPAFWLGLPLVLAVAAMIVGNAGRRAPTGAGKCIVGLVLGALASLFYLATYAMEVFGLAG